MFSDSHRLGDQAFTSGNKGAKKALVIAVSEYDRLSAARQLPFCKNDGLQIQEILLSQEYQMSQDQALIGRVEGDRMRNSILDFFLKSAGPHDTLIFYFSGHGLPDGFGNHYIVSSDTDPDYPDFHGFSFEDLENLAQKSPARRIVTILDCCYSGAAEAKAAGTEDSARSGRAKMDKVFAEGDGKCVLASSLGDQSSFKKKDADQSLFSYYLIDGLNGAGGESVNKDGYVTASTLGNYVFEKITENTKNQKPIAKTSMSGDIVLAYHPELSKAGHEDAPAQRLREPDPVEPEHRGFLKPKVIVPAIGGVVGIALLLAFVLQGTPDAKPNLAITFPSAGSTVSGNVTIKASSSDNGGVTNIDFYVDNEVIKRVYNPHSVESISWDTRPLANGLHSLEAMAYDDGGNVADVSLEVNVDNAGAVTPGPSSASYVFSRQWGTKGSGEGQLDGPVDIAMGPQQTVYVAEFYNSRVQAFSESGSSFRTWGSNGTGTGQFVRPEGIAVDSSGNVFVADQGNHRVEKFTEFGVFVAKWDSVGSNDGQFLLPVDVAVDSSNNVFVADRIANRVQKFTNDGQFVAAWGTSGNGDGQFRFPSSIAIDSSGNVYVVDSGNNRIQKFTNDGQFISKWGSFGSGDGQFDSPTNIAVDPSGSVYVSDAFHYRIEKFTNDGKFITKWGSFGSGDGQFNGIAGIAIDDSGDVYVADSGNDRIQVFSSQ